jgi:tetratricopeptide (TPR) repeat protein
VYWYQLGALSYARGDTVGAVRASQEYIKLLPTDMRGHLAAAQYMMAAGMMDSALAHLDIATADSSARRFAAPLYLQAGLQSVRDSNWTVAEQRLQRARDYAQGGTVVPAAFFLAVAQVQLAIRADNAAQSGRDCEAARRSQAYWNNAEQNMTTGGRQNPDVANQILTQVIPAYKQRAETMIRQYCR